MFVVLVEEGRKAVGPYRSYDLAKADARAWGGYVIPLEDRIKWATDGAVLRGARQRR